MTQSKCEGGCEKCKGEVKKYKVSGNGINWGDYQYCQLARLVNINDGFKVEKVNG